jgi:hypothetical protein
MNITGLILDFIGVVILLVYSERTQGATTPADRDYLAPSWWYRLGYELLGFGFLLQVVASSLN